MRAISILLVAALSWACARQPEIRGAELDALAEELIQYAAERTDLEPLPPPRIEFVEDVEAAFSTKYEAQVDLIIDGDGAANRIVAAYEPATGIVWLPNTWLPTTEDKASLLHELVHYLQHVQGRKWCRRDWEVEAYDIERQWLNGRGFGLPDDWGQDLIPLGCE